MNNKIIIMNNVPAKKIDCTGRTQAAAASEFENRWRGRRRDPERRVMQGTLCGRVALRQTACKQNESPNNNSDEDPHRHQTLAMLMTCSPCRLEAPVLL